MGVGTGMGTGVAAGAASAAGTVGAVGIGAVEHAAPARDASANARHASHPDILVPYVTALMTFPRLQMDALP